MTTAANTGFIFATAPVWGLLLGLALGFERPTWRGVLGVALSFVGVGLVFWEGITGAGGRSLIGDLLILLAALGVGSYTVFSMPILGRHSPSRWPPTRSSSEVPSSWRSPSRSLQGWSGRA